MFLVVSLWIFKYRKRYKMLFLNRFHTAVPTMFFVTCSSTVNQTPQGLCSVKDTLMCTVVFSVCPSRSVVGC